MAEAKSLTNEVSEAANLTAKSEGRNASHSDSTPLVEYTKTAKYARFDLGAKILTAIATATLGVVGLAWQWHLWSASNKTKQDEAVLIYLADQTRVIELTSVALDEFRAQQQSGEEFLGQISKFLAAQLSPSMFTWAHFPWMDRVHYPSRSKPKEAFGWLTVSFAEVNSPFGMLPDDQGRSETSDEFAALRIISTIWEGRSHMTSRVAGVRLGKEEDRLVMQFYPVSEPNNAKMTTSSWGIPKECAQAAGVLLKKTRALGGADFPLDNDIVANMEDVRRLANLRDSAAEHVSEALSIFPQLGREYLALRDRIRAEVQRTWTSTAMKPERRPIHE